ncbi:MAG: RNA polymerase sigma factor SigY [candidate division WS6 bacterium OLB20]|uniref:RNA polymerase sigma factor SigY n=1 Tax=candidate division WS6 bacterium OLB20 TaxID=1617426 RepID=A0A136LZ82_9BACT|nr:MAG: RNA polymerase sigma factor SigY [candidate division WS6 bacterium OLB20]
MQELIHAAQKGDPRALSELYKANFAWLYRYVRFRVTNDASAEDVCSEIFTKAFENIARFRAQSSFKNVAVQYYEE